MIFLGINFGESEISDFIFRFGKIRIKVKMSDSETLKNVSNMSFFLLGSFSQGYTAHEN